MGGNGPVKFLRLSRAVALIAVVVGAVGSLGLLLRAGQRTPRLLLVLFTIWVLSPFVALAWANIVSKRWSVLARATLYSATLVLTLGSSAIYGDVIPVAPPGSANAFVSVVVPPVSWLLIIVIVLIARLSPRRTRVGGLVILAFVISSSSAEAQERAVAAMFAAGSVQAQPSTIRIRAERLVDGTGHVIANATVVVEGSRISRIEMTSREKADYDLGEMTVLPGMIDVHSHIGWHFGPSGRFEPRAPTPARDVLYAAENAYLTLMAGFTTVQSPGQPGDIDLREAIARGVLLGPRILTSISQITPNSGTPSELRQKVRELKKQHADVVKIIASVVRGGLEQMMTRDQFEALCGEARSQGLRTMVHAQTTESVKAAVNAGCMQIEHGTDIDDSALRLMAERGVYFDPHVGVLIQNYIRNRPRFLGVADYTEESFASMEQAMKLNAAMIRKAVATPRLKLVMGSDAVAGAHGRNADELVERVRQGRQRPMDAIISATSLAAESLNLDREIGRLAPGYRADIIGVDGDPTTDITALTRVTFVMRNGMVYKR